MRSEKKQFEMDFTSDGNEELIEDKGRAT